MRFLRGLVCVAALVGGGHNHVRVSAEESSNTINIGFSTSGGFGGFGGFSTSGGGVVPDFDPSTICPMINTIFQGLNIPLPADFPTSLPNAPTLPPFFVCLDAKIKTFFQILMNLQNIAGDAEPTAAQWRSAGWPEAVAVPDISQFREMASKLKNLDGGAFGSSGMGGFPGGFDVGISGGAGAGAGGNTNANFPNLPDFNQIFDKLAPRMIPCSVSCPPSTLCVNGNQCITPQPICTKICNSNEFCQSTLNTTLLSAFNAQATASAFSAAGSGSISGGTSIGGGININIPPPPPIGEDGRPRIPIGSNGLPDFNSLLSLIQGGGRVNGTCRSLTPLCTSTSCGAGQICSPWDGCVACSVCGSIDLSGVARGGFDPSRFTGNIQVQGNGTARAFAPGIIAQIEGNANVFSDFVFGASGSGSAQAGSAISAFLNNSRSQMNQLLSNIQDATIQLGSNSQLMSRELRVALNATLAVVLQSGARAGCNTSININGPLIIRGVATAADIAAGQLGGVFNFPPRADGNTIGANAIVNVNGGAGLTGDLGSLGISISAAAAAAAAASVPSGETLRTSGAVLGAEARFIVRGALQLLNSAFQPTLSVASGAVVNIIRSGSNFTCGPLDLSAGGQVDIDAAGTSTFFKNVTQCAGGASIRIRVSSITSVQSGAVLFTYSSTTATIRAGYRCGIQLYDATGAVLSLRNPNVAQTAGRRLLDSTSGGSVTWDETGATYTNTDSGSGNKNAAAATEQAPTLMVVMAFVAAAMARLL